MARRLPLLTANLTACFVLIAACSDGPDNSSSPELNLLPGDVVVTRNPDDNGVSRMESENLGAELAPRSAYQQALAAGDFGAATQRFVESFPNLFGNRDVATYSVRSSSSDALGVTTVRLDQQYSGLPVFGGELLAHYSGTDLVRVVGDYAAAIELDSTTPAYPESAAFTVAAAAVSGLSDCASCSAQLGIYRPPTSNKRTQPRLVWQVDAGVSPINSWRIRIDTETLAILDQQPLALNAAL